jgi:hypothetical protein
MACMTRLAFSGSGSFSSSPRARGTTCHETPNLSVSQPQGPFSPPLGELLPELVHLLLGLAVDEQRDSLRERERGAAVQRHELLAGQLEGRRHQGALRPRTGRAVAARAEDPRAVEDRGVEVDRLLGAVVERQERGDLLLHLVLTGSRLTSSLPAPAPGGISTDRPAVRNSSVAVDEERAGADLRGR